MQHIDIYAGSHAFQHIQNQGLEPKDIKVIIGASGGPKWFVLSHLDRYLINQWLPNIPHQIELIGSSIGAWRMSAYASPNALQQIEHLEHQYLQQRYSAKPTIAEVSKSVTDLLDGFMDLNDLNHHKMRKLHIVSSRNKGLCKLSDKTSQAIIFGGVACANIISRKTLPFSFDRVVFQSSGGRLPVKTWDEFKTTHVELNQHNYRDALLSSGAIPVVIEGVKNPTNAPKGVYRDGGMVDYHFDLPIKPKGGLVLYPHFSPKLKPGWFDKALPWRKIQADNYSHTVVICPSQEFINSLPYQKIPDRKDFDNLDSDTRIKYWKTVVDRNQAIADAFDNWSQSNNPSLQVKSIDLIARK